MIPQVIWIGGIAKYGTDSEEVGYLVNHDETCDYGDVSEPTEVEAYKVCGKENFERQYKRKEPRTFKQFRGKVQESKPKIGPQKMKENLGKTCEKNEIMESDRPSYRKSMELV